jgi:hypothetical protein
MISLLLVLYMCGRWHASSSCRNTSTADVCVATTTGSGLLARALHASLIVLYDVTSTQCTAAVAVACCVRTQMFHRNNIPVQFAETYPGTGMAHASM